MKEGFFISLEGFEGSGKTTIAKKMHEILTKNKYKAMLTKEPGGTYTADKIREILLEKETKNLGNKAELLLFAASRSENVLQNIKPALKNGFIVITDRYFDSTTAYQGYGRGLDMEAVNFINEFVTENIIPNLTFYLDVDPEIGLKRSTVSSQGKEMRFEDEFLKGKIIKGKLFLERVRDGYLKIAAQNPKRIKIINSNRSIDFVLNDIIAILNNSLPRKLDLNKIN
ncbi:MAG: dTMP kinase [Atribacterota bacterium]|nr:dTMP kinase [Atribacterota bacterium]